MRVTVLTKGEIGRFSFGDSEEMKTLHAQFKGIFRTPIDFEKY